MLRSSKRNRPLLRSKRLAVVLCLAPLLDVSVAQAVRGRLQARHLSSSELTATRALLSAPHIARAAGPFETDAKQMYALVSSGKVRMYVEPVKYDSYDIEVPTHTSVRCGVFFLSSDGTASFLPTIGYGQYEPVQCGRLKKVKFMYGKENPVSPRIEMYYEGSTPNSTSEQYVSFSWSEAKKAYMEGRE